MFRRKARPFLLVLLGLLLGRVAVAWDPADAPSPKSGVDRTYLDPSIRPQDDLFRHVSGKWLATAPIPPDRSLDGAFYSLRDKAEADLRAIIEQATRVSDPSLIEARKVGDLYGSFLDEAAVESLGIKPIQDDLALIDAIQDKAGLVKAMGKLAPTGGDIAFAAGVSTDAKQSDRYAVYLEQAGLGLPDESYYRLPNFQKIRDAYVAHLQKLFELAGAADPAGSAAKVFALETLIAKEHWDRVKRRDSTLTYNKLTREALATLMPGFDWDAFATEAGFKLPETVIVREPSFFAGLAKLLDSQPVADWKAWLKARTLDGRAALLSKPFADEDFAFHGKILTGAQEIKPRWKRGVAVVEAAMGEAVGRIYVSRHFPPEAKARMARLVANLVEAYRIDIESLEWMSSATKAKALEKLARFTPKIGYPDKWRDYSKLEIRRDDLVGNVRRASRFEFDRDFAKLGTPVDRLEWQMTPQTVNAYYNPGMNEIVFPAAILQPPFFDLTADDAVNYGGIGAVIGHEIGHGFDDQGSKYDGEGNMKDWWTEADRKEFESRAKKLIDQYSGYEPAQLPGQHVNGALTIGENIGDLGGLTIALKAYKLALGSSPAPVLDGLTGDQRFFFGWAQVWRAKYRDAELIRRLTTDPHSPAEFRCNGVIRNVPGFYEAFGLKEGDKLWLPPDQRVVIW
jgi:putative endopeptidase